MSPVSASLDYCLVFPGLEATISADSDATMKTKGNPGMRLEGLQAIVDGMKHNTTINDLNIAGLL